EKRPSPPNTTRDATRLAELPRPPPARKLATIAMTEAGMSSESPTIDQPSCACLRAGEPFIGKQGLCYAPAISAETVGARAIHMQLLTIPPGARAKAHKH